MRTSVGKAELEQRALRVVREALGKPVTKKVAVRPLVERDAVGRNWEAASFEPEITDPGAAFRVFKALAALADKFDLAE